MAYYSNNSASVGALMPDNKIFIKGTFLIRKGDILVLKLAYTH
jgi:hypothetical protein